MTQTNGHHAQLEVTSATRTKLPAKVKLEEIERATLTVTTVALSDLIVNNPSAKMIEEQEWLRSLDDEAKKIQKKQPKPPVVPEEKFQAARLLDEDGRDCVQARWIKAMLGTAAYNFSKELGINRNTVKGCVYVVGELIPIVFKGKPVMRRDIVRVEDKFGKKSFDIRYRPSYRNWSLKFELMFEPKLVPLASLHQLIRRAGSSVGLCEWRPGKSEAGVFGRFDLASAK